MVSGVFNPPTDSYDGNAFSKFGYEHVPNTQTPASSTIYFSMDGAETWTVQGGAFPAIAGGELGPRLISNEPMVSAPLVLFIVYLPSTRILFDFSVPVVHCLEFGDIGTGCTTNHNGNDVPREILGGLCASISAFGSSFKGYL